MNTIQKQFSDALKREGKTVTTYYTSESVSCLFRKNNDNNSTDHHATIFYDVSAPIKQGQLLSFNGKYFITLNKETVENDCYNKSALLECNVIVPLVSNSLIQNIPCYAGNLYSTILSDGKLIDLVDGRVDIITESTDFVNNATFNSQSQFMGGYYNLKNKANKSGIAYLYFERGQAPQHTYTLNLTSSATTYEIDTTTQLTASAKIDGLTDGTATIVYTSSDDTLATVDSTGLVTFKAEGVVTITAIWLEQSIQKSIELTITEEEIVSPSYTMSITADMELTLYMTSTFTPHLKDSDGVEQPFTAVWTIDYNGVKPSLLSITYNGNLCKVKVADDFDLLGKEITLTCTTDDGLYSATYTSMITAGW